MTTNSYDLVPYLDRSHAQSHPDRAATLATLLGLRPACLERCRVLELGCANGRNLLPMAAALPGAHFVGVDLSARQVADGQAAVAELGLTNLELRHASIADVDAGYGLFDYIICHGVYSWVEAALQDKILAVSRANLAENGVAYVSYNLFPGWHDKLKVREMLLYLVGPGGEPAVRIRKAREYLSLMADLVAPEGAQLTPYGARLRSEAELIQNIDDDYVFHEYLEAINQPVYFYEFAERAARHGLQYLADADRGLRSLDSLPAPVLEALRRHADDILSREQFLDFYTNHTFRSTLLVAAGGYLDRGLTPDRLHGLAVSSSLQPIAATPDITGPGYETFGAPDHDNTFASTHPGTKAALLVLREAYPNAVPFEALVAQAVARLYPPGAPEGDLAHSKVLLTREADTIGRNLLQGHTASSNLIEFHAHRPALAVPAAAAEGRPRALASARFEALRSRSVTNAYHRPVQLGPLSWYLLPFLDGTRDLAALVELAMANQGLALEKGGEELSDPGVKRPLLRAEVSSALGKLARAALIEAGPPSP